MEMNAERYFVFFTIAALIYSILIYTVYLFKDKKKNIPNKLFSFLCRITILSMAIELVADFGIPRLNISGIGALLIARFYMYSNICWAFTICCYAVYVSMKKYGDPDVVKFKNYRIFLTTLFAISCIVVSFFKVDYFINEKVNLLVYLTGPSVIASFVFSFAFVVGGLVVYVIAVIKNRAQGEKLKKRTIFFIGGSFLWSIQLAVVQLMQSEITLISFSQVVILVIIYFFVGNPDLDLLKQVSTAKSSADVANTAKTNFLASMSHEIRTPLNAIVGLSEHIRSNKNISDTVRDDIDDITAASNNLLEIIGNIIDINKIESESLEINEVKYVFTDEVEPLIRVVSTRLGDKPIELHVHIDNNIPFELIGDKFHVKSVINNFFTNAIKYTEKGYINLNIIATDIVPNDSCVIEISVEDSGVGIKPENISKLFTKFDRLDFEGNTKVEGSGLGLSITKKVVTLMGGKIDVSSTYGEGSKFTARIPQKISKMECELTNTQRIDIGAINERINSDTYSGRRVLLVDDNKLNLKVARKAIEPFNFVVEECVNGEECLNKVIAGNKYDLILMDIMMPVMDGETAMKELMKLPGFDTPVIAVTADAIAGAKEKYLSEGFTEYIAKPFTKDQMKVKLDAVFRHEFDQVDKVVILSNNN